MRDTQPSGAYALPVGDPAAVTKPTINATVLCDDVMGMRILVIDDEVAVRKGMHAILEDWGCLAMLVSTEDEALEILQSNSLPDIIIADYRLRDGKTGVQVIERLRREIGMDIPALIVTGDTAPERLREAQASGHTLMYKPVQPGKLRAYLRRVQRLKNA